MTSKLIVTVAMTMIVAGCDSRPAPEIAKLQRRLEALEQRLDAAEEAAEVRAEHLKGYLFEDATGRCRIEQRLAMLEEVRLVKVGGLELINKAGKTVATLGFDARGHPYFALDLGAERISLDRRAGWAALSFTAMKGGKPWAELASLDALRGWHQTPR